MFCSRLERHFLIFFDWHFQKFDRSDQPRSKFKAYLGATKQIRDKKGLRWKVADMIQDKVLNVFRRLGMAVEGLDATFCLVLRGVRCDV